MLFPTKYENLNKSPLVLGANIIAYLNQQEDLNLNSVFKSINNWISYDEFLDVIVFLWLSGVIIVDFNSYSINLKKYDS